MRRTGSELHTVRREEGQSWTDAILAALDERTASSRCQTCTGPTGRSIDLAPVGERAHELGAAFVLDLSQSRGRDARRRRRAAARTSWSRSATSGCSAPSASPTSTSTSEHREGEPIEHNWIVREGADDFAGLVDYTDSCSPEHAASTSARARTSSSPRWRSRPWSRSSTGRFPASRRSWPRRRPRSKRAPRPAADRRPGRAAGPHIVGIEVPEARRRRSSTS